MAKKQAAAAADEADNGTESGLPSWLTEDDNGATIELTKPIDIDGATVSHVTMREPTVQDQIDMQSSKANDAVKEVNLLANLCELSPADIKGLTWRNYKRLQVALENFTE